MFQFNGYGEKYNAEEITFPDLKILEDDNSLSHYISDYGSFCPTSKQKKRTHLLFALPIDNKILRAPLPEFSDLFFGIFKPPPSFRKFLTPRNKSFKNVSDQLIFF